jgi:ribosomal protein S18 acetylase RimI-like enzyme
MTVLLAPASEFDLGTLARIFTAGYEGYVVTMNVDEAALRFMVDAWDIELARSRVALEDGEPVGLAFLAVRGGSAWIGGVGVALASRGRGIGRRLMEAVLTEAPRPVSLEVIEQNVPAKRLYDSLGFEVVRMLEVWSLTEDAPASDARSLDRPRPLGQASLPWQRQDASLPENTEGLETDRGTVLFRISNDRVSIVQLDAADEAAAARLLAAARARGTSLHYVNVPEGDPASAALARLGGTATCGSSSCGSRAPSSPSDVYPEFVWSPHKLGYSWLDRAQRLMSLSVA